MLASFKFGSSQRLNSFLVVIVFANRSYNFFAVSKRVRYSCRFGELEDEFVHSGEALLDQATSATVLRLIQSV